MGITVPYNASYVAIYITSTRPKICHLDVLVQFCRLPSTFTKQQKNCQPKSVFSLNNKIKRFLRIALMSVRFLFLILLPHAVTMEQEYCMPEDNCTNVAIPFRLLYEGKFNFREVLILACN
jgi:hypothetical protein